MKYAKIALVLTILTNGMTVANVGQELKYLEKSLPSEKKQFIKPKIKIPYLKEQKEKKNRKKVKIFIKKIILIGNNPKFSKELTQLIKPFEEKELTLNEIQKIANLITDWYRKHGFITSLAIIPPQKINNGVLKIRIIEGTIYKIKIYGNKRYPVSLFKKYLSPIKKEKPFNLNTLTRQLLILNRFLFLKTSAYLTKGEKPLTSDIVLQVKEEKRWKVLLNYDNYGSKNTSRNRFLFLWKLGDINKYGDLLEITALKGLDRIDHPNLEFFSITYRIPLSINGDYLGLKYAHSYFKTVGPLSELGYKGKGDFITVYYQYPLILTLKNSLDLKIGFSYKDIYDFILNERNSKEPLRTIFANFNWQNVFFGGINTFGLTISQGIKGFIGPISGKLSRVNEKLNFHKLEITLNRVQPLTESFYAFLKVNAQITDQRLPSSEMFILGGWGSVRGYKPAQYNGDKGISTSMELHYKISNLRIGNKKLLNNLDNYIFWDWGTVYVNHQSEGEYAYKSATSLGIGSNWVWDSHFKTSMNIALPQINDKFYKAVIYLRAQVEF